MAPFVILAIQGLNAAYTMLGAAYYLCVQLKDGQAACLRVHARLTQLLFELHKQTQNGGLPNTDAIDRSLNLLNKYHDHLTKYQDHPFFKRMWSTMGMREELLAIHTEIDTLFQMLGLATAGVLMSLKAKLELDFGVQHHKLNVIANSNAKILCGVEANASSLAQLHHKLDIQHQKLNELSSERATRDALFLWTVEIHEVDYEEVPFAKHSDASMHHGHWAGTPTVFKLYHSATDGLAAVAMIKEANVWRHLQHPHIVRLFAASTNATPPFVICEDGGVELATYMDASVDNQIRLWELALQAARGLKYLHDKGIVHGNICASSILVGHDDIARLTDFSMSLRVSAQVDVAVQYPLPTEAARATVGHCGVETPSIMSDVYMLGICIIHVATGKQTLAELTTQDIGRIQRAGRRSKQPCKAPWELIRSMTSNDPSQRPSISQVITTLTAIVTRDALQIPQASSPVSTSGDNYCVHCGSNLQPMNRAAKLVQSRHPLQSTLTIETKPETQDATKSSVVAEPPPPNSNPQGSSPTAESKLSTPVDAKVIVAGLREGPDRQKLHYLDRMARVAADGRDNREVLARCGALKVLLGLLRGNNKPLQLHAANALLSVCLDHKTNCKRAVAMNAHQTLIQIAKSGDGPLIEQAIAVLLTIAKTSNKNRKAIAESGGIAAMIRLLQLGTDKAKKLAAEALGWTIYENEDNAKSAVVGGAITHMMELLGMGTKEQKLAAAFVIARLARDTSDRSVKDILRRRSAVSLLEALHAKATADRRYHIEEALHALTKPSLRVVVPSTDKTSEPVKSGWLYRQSERTAGEWTKVWVVLCAMTVSIELKPAKMPYSSEKVELRGARIVSADQSEVTCTNATLQFFKVVPSDEAKTCLLGAETVQSKQQWIDALVEQVNALLPRTPPPVKSAKRLPHGMSG